MAPTVLFLLAAISVGFISGNHAVTLHSCDYYLAPSITTGNRLAEEMKNCGNVSSDGKTMYCHPGFDKCMALWSVDLDDENTTTTLLKGCWEGNGDCERENCIAHGNVRSRYLNVTRFCCCSSTYCNTNLSYVFKPLSTKRVLWPPRTPTGGTTSNFPMAIVIMIIMLIIAVIMLSIFFVYQRFYLPGRLKKLNKSDAENGHANQRLLDGVYNGMSRKDRVCDCDQIDLITIINQGRYGTVWRAVHKSNGELLAVKIYPMDYHVYFCNERHIYSIYGMQHENIVPYYGACEKRVGPHKQDPSIISTSADPKKMELLRDHMSMQYWIITRLMPEGTLQDFLKGNTVSWETMCRMGASIANGLSYLHGTTNVNGTLKPPIAHRDLNSRNVLMKADGTCAICDFGFALALEEEKRNDNAHQEAMLTEVGTYRYWAPEVIEGAVNLRDPLSALKEVDVYALGLVLWEIMHRCSSIYGLTSKQKKPDV